MDDMAIRVTTSDKVTGPADDVRPEPKAAAATGPKSNATRPVFADTMVGPVRLTQFAGAWRKVGGSGPDELTVKLATSSGVHASGDGVHLLFDGINDPESPSTFNRGELYKQVKREGMEYAMKLTGGSLVVTKRVALRGTTIEGFSGAYEKIT